MIRLDMLTARLVVLVMIASLSLVGCDSDDEAAEEETDGVETEVEVLEPEPQEAEEAQPELPAADSSFTYIPFRSDQETVEQEGHAMAFVEYEEDEIAGFRVRIAPTHIEFVCGDPMTQQRGSLEEGEESLTLIAADGFEFEEGDQKVEFINVGNTGVDAGQDLRFEFEEIGDDEIVGRLALHGDEDDEPRVSAEFRAARCDA